MLVVIDTNVLVSSLSSRSPYHIIVRNLLQRKFELVISNEVLLEYEERLNEKYGPVTTFNFIVALKELPIVLFREAYFKWNLITNDEEDNKFCDLAISASVDFLVSEDSDFSILKKLDFPKVNLIGIETFQKMVTEL